MTTERVGASKTDAHGYLKLNEAVNMLQDCSMLWMESEPLFKGYLSENNLGMFLVTRQIDVNRLPQYGERVIVKTSIYQCKRFLGYRNTVLYGEDGSSCLLTWSTGTFVSLQSGKVSMLPKEVLNSVTLDEKIEMAYLDSKIKLPNGHIERFDPIAVKRSDIDLYNHMNNAKYIEAAMEMLAEDFRVKRLRIEYKIPAKQGDLLYPQRVKDETGKQYIALMNDAGNPFTLMEFT